MPEYYNLTNITNANVTDYVGFIQAVDTNIMGGSWLGLIIMLMVFFTFTIAVKSRGYYTLQSVAVGCWMVTLCAIFLRGLSLIGDLYWYGALLLTPLAIFALFVSENR